MRRKATLARQRLPPASANNFDLADPISLARLQAPLTALSEQKGAVPIDEVGRHVTSPARYAEQIAVFGSESLVCAGLGLVRWTAQKVGHQYIFYALMTDNTQDENGNLRYHGYPDDEIPPRVRRELLIQEVESESPESNFI